MVGVRAVALHFPPGRRQPAATHQPLVEVEVLLAPGKQRVIIYLPNYANDDPLFVRNEYIFNDGST